MSGLEKLQEYGNAKTVIDGVEGELCEMVDLFFKDRRGTWYFDSLHLDGDTCVLKVEQIIMGEGEYYIYPVPTQIITKFLDGDRKGAAKEFVKWYDGYLEQKRRDEEARKRQEMEIQAKAQEERDYRTYLELKERFGNK